MTLLRRLAALLSPRDTLRWVVLVADAAVLSMAPNAAPKAAARQQGKRDGGGGGTEEGKSMSNKLQPTTHKH